MIRLTLAVALLLTQAASANLLMRPIVPAAAAGCIAANTAVCILANTGVKLLVQ